MPTTTIRGVSIAYEVLGERGAWVALSPGGRRDMSGVRGIAARIAAAGYRVLLHDRRNCGASDVVIDGADVSEYEIWADDFYELLKQLDALPVIAGGSSSGCRTAMLLALRHPDAVSALLLWRVTGGPFAAQRLAENYYGQFIDAANRGGITAVCETEFFRERMDANPANRDRLLAMTAEQFIDVMARWREFFLKSAELPVIGATEADLQSIGVPTCVVPGNDRTHGRATGETAARLLPNSELHSLAPEHEDVDVADWDDKDGELAAIFVDFLSRVAEPARA
ncbi:MAG TPA: alpha/beta hydrolase [Dehalococcoidia bacterium]|nr:alpha/beta hydrolase [Dehalococcoidia bacterium]